MSATTSAEVDAEDGAVESTARRRTPAVLIAIATVLAIVSTLTTWVKTQALDTDQWVEVSGELLAEEEVQEALAVYLVDQVYALLDVPTEIERALPRDLSGLAAIAAAALRDPATNGVERLIASERFASGWERVNRRAHEVLVRTLRDENRDGISATGGAVTLELGELLRQTATDLGLSGDRLDQLPDDAGSITIFSSDELSSAQTAVQILDFLSWFLFIVVVVLFALAVFLAVGRRTRVLRNVGLSLVLAGIVILLVRAIAIRLATASIVEDPDNVSLADLVLRIATDLIRDTAWTAIVLGLVIAACAWLLSPSTRAGAVRRVTAPLTNVSDGVFVAGSVALALLLWWWNPGDIFGRFVTGATVVVMLGAALIALRTRNRADFADVTVSDVAGSISRRPPPPDPSPSPDPDPDSPA